MTEKEREQLMDILRVQLSTLRGPTLTLPVIGSNKGQDESGRMTDQPLVGSGEVKRTWAEEMDEDSDAKKE
jgi:hypothetical protein